MIIRLKGLENITSSVRQLCTELEEHFTKFSEKIRDLGFRYEKLLDTLGLELHIEIVIHLDEKTRGIDAKEEEPDSGPPE